MKWRGLKLAGVALIVGSVVGSGSALADRGGHHGGSHIGLGFYFGPGSFGYPAYPYAYPVYPGYYSGYYPGYYYPPAVVAVPAQPPQYIERSDEEPQYAEPAAPAYWYHCAKPEGYYPYVTSCPGGWQTVPAQPPAK